MTFASDGARLPARYVDLDRCILLGPDAALMRQVGSPREEGSYACSASSPPWLLELYAEDEETVRVLIAGDED